MTDQHKSTYVQQVVNSEIKQNLDRKIQLPQKQKKKNNKTKQTNKTKTQQQPSRNNKWRSKQLNNKKYENQMMKDAFQKDIHLDIIHYALSHMHNPIYNMECIIHPQIWWRHQMARYWPFAWGIHRSPANSPHKGQWRGDLVFSSICAMDKRLSEQSRGWWFVTPLCPLWRQCNDV